MRILGFSKKWDKLQRGEFTTFRFKRKDHDWNVGEVVQIVYKPRSKDRGILGVAEIINLEPRSVAPYTLGGPSNLDVSHREAVEDGFENVVEMVEWFEKTYGEERLTQEVMNKLTLRWVGRE